MAYYLDVFSPETYEAFTKSNQDITGFTYRFRKAASRIKPGDIFICYLTKLSRWFGLLEVIEGPFTDETPIFYPEDDPFIIRFKVRVKVWLPIDKAIPIYEDEVWNNLSFTQNFEKHTSGWTGKVRSSLGIINDDDAKLLEEIMILQKRNGNTYEVDPQEYQKFLRHRVRTPDKMVAVTIPEDDTEIRYEQPEVRDSVAIQALIAKIGAEMGFKIWLPRNDRNRVIEEVKLESSTVLSELPLNYNDTTIKTIEQIDIIWLRRGSIIRAFEVEHTTSIYSGILRMADLLSLQKNLNIKLHIVAPEKRRNKVFQEINRPVFSLLDGGPLSDKCTYLPYESIREISGLKHLAHLNDSVLDDYSEDAD